MEVRSDRHYEFAVGPDEVWSALTRIDDYRSWWPWLKGFEGESFSVGARWACVVQPPLPYVVRFNLELHEVVAPRLATAMIDGDIAGRARLDIDGDDRGCVLHLVSELAPTNRVLRGVARLARPLVTYGHEWVLDTGLRQFQAHAL